MTQIDITRAEAIARLNDNVRLGLDRNAKIVFTRACIKTLAGDNFARGIVVQAHLRSAIQDHQFGTDDPHGERDFGAFEFRGERLFFKIDCYDLALEFGSEDPANASVTRRVMTIMLASDY